MSPEFTTEALVVEHAERLYRLGLLPVPLCHPIASGGRCSAGMHVHDPPSFTGSGRTPVVAGFMEWRKSPPPFLYLVNQLKRHRPANLALVLPADIVAVETHSSAADAEVRRLVGALATPCRRGRTGPNGWIFSLPPGMTIANQDHLGSSGRISLRASGLFVAPPSVHVRGYRYEWERAPWDTAVARIPDNLLELIREPQLVLSSCGEIGQGKKEEARPVMAAPRSPCVARARRMLQWK